MAAPIKNLHRFALPSALPEEGSPIATRHAIRRKGKAITAALGLPDAWKQRSRRRAWVLAKHTAWYILHDLGYSQVQIADAAGYNSTTVSWVCREKMPAIIAEHPGWKKSVYPELIAIAKEA